MIEYIFVVNTLMFLFIAVIWSSKNLLNVLFKIVVIILTVANALMALQGIGFVFRNIA